MTDKDKAPQSSLNQQLYFAIMLHPLETVSALLEKGAKADLDPVVDSSCQGFKYTPIEWATLYHRNDVVELLLKKGAKPLKKASRGGPSRTA